MNPGYNARFGWFWINDAEMFPKDPDALDRKMKMYADRGLTHVILFGVTHFRWTFRPNWGIIHDCLRRVCEAGHKYGVKVIEHHSAILSHYPDSPEKLKRMANGFALRDSSIDSWPGIREYVVDDSRRDQQWIQRDGGTEEPVSAYGGHAICPSNDEFIEEYLKELGQEYACGLDGIMTDDVQFYGHCGCASCRKKFKERTGLDLPDKEHWKEWFGDTRKASFRAWMRYRHDIIREFHVKVKKHYDSLGKKLLRPNYIAGALYGNYSGICVEDLPELHWLFQECMFGSIIRYSFQTFLMEERHRRMVAERRNIPHMMMFYAEHPETVRFTWGIARLAGAMFTNSPRNAEELDEKPYRDYEQKHAAELFDAEMVSDFAFLDSLEDRKMDASYEASRNKFWMQSCIFNNLAYDLVSTSEPDKWKKYPLLCMNELHLLKDQEIRNLVAYVESGGTLVLTGLCGALDDDGGERSAEALEKLWGFPLNHTAHEMHVFQRGKGKIFNPGYAFGYPVTEEEARYRFEDFPQFFDFMSVYTLMPIRKDCDEVWTDRFAKNDNTVYNGAYQEGAPAREQVVSFLKGLLQPQFQAEIPELVLAVPWRNCFNDDMTIRLLNASGCFVPKGTPVSHNDLPPFPVHQGNDWTFRIHVPENRDYTAEYETLETAPSALECRREKDMLVIRMKPSLLKDFGMIRIKAVK